MIKKLLEPFIALFYFFMILIFEFPVVMFRAIASAFRKELNSQKDLH